MDFSKFLESGELSDITVVVGDEDFRLHKFPLYIKSDFFRALARSALADKDRIALTDFPGGPDTFRAVAAYCYNTRVDVTKQNVCQLRCAAEFLQMGGPANLAGLTDRFLVDVLSTAKMRRRLEPIGQLVRQCRRLGQIAEQAGIVERCIQAVVDSWLVPSKYSRHLHTDLGIVDTDNLTDFLTRFPLSWFSQLLKASRDKSVSPAVLTSLVQRYVDLAVDRSAGGRRRRRFGPPPDAKTASAEAAEDDRELPNDVEYDRELSNDAESEHSERRVSGNDRELPDDADAEPEVSVDDRESSRTEEEDEEDEEKMMDGDEDTAVTATVTDGEEEEFDDGEEKDGPESTIEGDDVSEVEMSPRKPVELSEFDLKHAGSTGPESRECGEAIDEAEDDVKEELSDAELSNLLETLFGDIPPGDYPLVADTLPTSWIIAMLLLTDELGCGASRDVLLKLAACVAHRFGADELVQLSPETFVSVINLVAEGSGESSADRTHRDRGLAASQVCRAVDVYLKALSERGELTADVYRLVVDAVPDDWRTNDDSFFHVLRGLLVSGKVGDIADGERESLLESIDYERLSESALQTAYESKLVPADFVAKAALNLCAKLRADLESANAIIRMNEAELERKNRSVGVTGLTGSGWTGRADVTDGGYTRSRCLPSPSPKTGLYSTGTGSGSASYRTGTGTAVGYGVRSAATGSGGCADRTTYDVGHSTYRNVPSMASHIELELALEKVGGGSSSLLSAGYGSGDYPSYLTGSDSYFDEPRPNAYRSTYGVAGSRSTTGTSYYKRHV